MNCDAKSYTEFKNRYKDIIRACKLQYNLENIPEIKYNIEKFNMEFPKRKIVVSLNNFLVFNLIVPDIKQNTTISKLEMMTTSMWQGKPVYPTYFDGFKNFVTSFYTSKSCILESVKDSSNVQSIGDFSDDIR